MPQFTLAGSGGPHFSIFLLLLYNDNVPINLNGW
jgi:hypothetical protein